MTRVFCIVRSCQRPCDRLERSGFFMEVGWGPMGEQRNYLSLLLSSSEYFFTFDFSVCGNSGLEWRRERKTSVKERHTDWVSPACIQTRARDWACHPDRCPGPDIEPETIWCTGWCSNHSATLSRATKPIFGKVSKLVQSSHRISTHRDSVCEAHIFFSLS